MIPPARRAVRKSFDYGITTTREDMWDLQIVNIENRCGCHAGYWTFGQIDRSTSGGGAIGGGKPIKEVGRQLCLVRASFFDDWQTP